MKKLLSSLMLAVYPDRLMAAFAQDQMNQDAMKKDDAKQDTMKNDQMKKDKKSKKTAKKDSMKKDDMKKDNMKDDNMKKDDNEERRDEEELDPSSCAQGAGSPSPRFTLFNLAISSVRPPVRHLPRSISMSASASHSSAICPADAVSRYFRMHRTHGTYPSLHRLFRRQSSLCIFVVNERRNPARGKAWHLR